MKIFAKGLLREEAGAVGDWRSYTEEKSFSKKGTYDQKERFDKNSFHHCVVPLPLEGGEYTHNIGANRVEFRGFAQGGGSKLSADNKKRTLEL